MAKSDGVESQRGRDGSQLLTSRTAEPASDSAQKPPALLERLQDPLFAKRAFQLVILAFVALGVGLRVWAYLIEAPSLWQDEAYWAVQAINKPAIKAQIRPLGFMLVSQGLLKVFGPTELVYRFLPFLLSMLAALVAPYVAQGLMRSRWAIALAVLCIETNPVALEMSAEFKHYGCDIGVYAGLLALFVFHRRRGSWWSLALLLGLAWLSFFFSIVVIFLFPALFGGLLWSELRARRWRRLAAVLGTAAVCMATITTIYFTTWRGINQAKAEKKWGTWYNVFYLEKGLRNEHDSKVLWYADKYADMAALAGIGRKRWESPHLPPEDGGLRGADRAIWCALHLAGIAYLGRRRRITELAWLWSPLLLVFAFNLAGRWPGGAFRTNSFYVPYATLLAAVGVDGLAAWLPGRARLVAALASALAMLPTLLFRPGWVQKGTFTKPGAITDAFAVLVASPPRSSGRQVVVMDYETCRPWQYYIPYDEQLARGIGPKLRKDFKPKCLRQGKKIGREIQRLAAIEKDRGFWIVLTDPRKYGYVERLTRRTCAKVDATFIEGRTHLVLYCLGAKQAPKKR